MTDVMIATAEEEFSKKSVVSAFNWAMLANSLDPFYPNVNRYVEVYRIHVAAVTKLPSGTLDCYSILGIREDPVAVSTETIIHTYVKLVEIIDPEVNCSKAVPSAFKLIATAFEVLSHPKCRRAFPARNGLPPPQEQSLPSSSRSCAPRRHNSSGIRSCRCSPARVV